MEAPAPVQVTAVTQDTIRRIVAGDGVLFPRDQASVMPKIAAPVQRFLVQRGDHVKQGQLLAVLESRDLTAGAAESQAQVAQAEANLRSITSAQVPESIVKAQTDVDTAKQTEDAAKKLLDNREKLFQQGALARKLVDEAQVAYAQAHGALLSAQEHLRALQSVGKEEQIRTAASQVDAARSHLQSSAGPGQLLADCQPDLRRGRRPSALRRRDGHARHPARHRDGYLARSSRAPTFPRTSRHPSRVGQPATITQVDTNQTVEGKVTVVSPATDPNSTTIQVWVQAENPGEQLKPGTSVHVAIMTEIIKATPVVPIAAILPGEEGGTACLVITPDNIAHRRNVKLGVREGDKVQILNGVRPGEEVVIVGGMGLDDKAKVKVIDPTVKEAPDEDENAPEEKPAKDQKKDEAKPKSK